MTANWASGGSWLMLASISRLAISSEFRVAMLPEQSIKYAKEWAWSRARRTACRARCRGRRHRRSLLPRRRPLLSLTRESIPGQWSADRARHADELHWAGDWEESRPVSCRRLGRESLLGALSHRPSRRTVKCSFPRSHRVLPLLRPGRGHAFAVVDGVDLGGESFGTRRLGDRHRSVQNGERRNQNHQGMEYSRSAQRP